MHRTIGRRSLRKFEVGEFRTGLPDGPMSAECIFQPERSILYFHAYHAAFRCREYGRRHWDSRVSLGFHLDRDFANYDHGRDATLRGIEIIVQG